MAGRSQNALLAAARVARDVAVERVKRPKATRYEDVPPSVAAITPEWLSAVLCRDVPGAQVLDVSAQTASSGTHQRDRLLVAYNEAGRAAGLPTSIFTKSTPTIVTRMMCGFNGTARVEGQFYMNVRPLLDIEAPIGYHAAFDRESMRSMLLLEDLVATKDATFANFRTYVTRPMAEEIVDTLASLHGRFYNDPVLDGFKWLADYGAWFRIGSTKMRTEHYTAKALDKASHLIPAGVLARRQEVWPAVVRGAEVHDVRPPSFLHSDVHIGNWYINSAGGMGLCDWQCPSKGHWSRDVSYALSAALEPNDRRAWERELFARYLEHLSERTGETFDPDDSWELYRQQLFHALWMWTITLCHSPLLPSMQSEETSLTMIQRITTAIDDLDAFDSFSRR